jgi:hypothetical protein
MAAQAKMLGVWVNVNNPNRSTSDVLNLTVGGTILLNDEAVKLVGEGLMRVKIKVMDSDTFEDDLLLTNETFQIGVHDTSPRCFHTGVIVPASKLNDCEPFWESWAEVYCRVSAKGGSVQTNATNSQTANVRVD